MSNDALQSLAEAERQLAEARAAVVEEQKLSALKLKSLSESLAEARAELERVRAEKEYVRVTDVVDRDLRVHDTLLTMLAEQKARAERLAEAANRMGRELSEARIAVRLASKQFTDDQWLTIIKESSALARKEE